MVTGDRFLQRFFGGSGRYTESERQNWDEATGDRGNPRMADFFEVVWSSMPVL